jgi:hypothetical protein
VDLRDTSHGILQLFGVEAEGPWFAFVRHVAGGVDQVKAVWPCRVRLLRGVAEFIEHGRNIDPELADAGTRDETAFFFAPWTGEDDIFLNIALHLPDVAGVRLSDVHDQERDLLSILLVELVEGRNLPPKRRSSVASKYEHDRLALRSKRRQLHLRTFIQLRQSKVRRGISHLQFAGTSAHPQGLKWKHEECDWTRYSSHDPGKGLRRLPHDREQRAAGEHPQERDHAQCCEQFSSHGSALCGQSLLTHLKLI